MINFKKSKNKVLFFVFIDMENDFSFMVLKRCLDKELNDCVEVFPLIKEYLNKKYWVKTNGEIFLEYTDGTFFMNSGEFYFIQTVNNLSKLEMMNGVSLWINEKLNVKHKLVLPISYKKK